MGESVRVVVKCRPLNASEKGLGCESIVTIDPDRAACSIRNPREKTAPTKTFVFDGAYGEEVTNEQVYSNVAFTLVEAFTEGFHGTIFAYGQTGCGKTFSMQGVTESPAQRGLIPRALEQIFDTISIADSSRYLIHASFLEIYNEDIRDLLGKDMKSKFELKEKPDGTVFVKDLSMHPCACIRDCERLIETGWSRRSVGATLMNAVSSRSHSVFTIHLERCDVRDDGDNRRIRVSKLNLVDLAGSERQGKTGATGERFKESTRINLSLSALGNVISALVDGRCQHIPYRDSKLTRLLQDSLGGNTKTLMIACLSPSDNSYEETLSTLRYANRAKNIRNRPKMNEDPKDALIREYLEEIAKLKAMLADNPQQTTPALQTQQQQQQQEQQQLILLQQQQQQQQQEQQQQKSVAIERAQNENEPDRNAKALVVKYEEKIDKMKRELEDAKTKGSKASSELQRLIEENEAEKRRLKERHEVEEKKMLEELEVARRGRQIIALEMHRLKDAFHKQLEKVEKQKDNSPEKAEIEKQKIVENYEEQLERMKDELNTMKKTKEAIQVQMDELQTAYAVEIQKTSAAIQPELLALEREKIREEEEEEVKQQGTQRLDHELEAEILAGKLHAAEVLRLQEQQSEGAGLLRRDESCVPERKKDDPVEVRNSEEEAPGKETDEVVGTKPEEAEQHRNDPVPRIQQPQQPQLQQQSSSAVADVVVVDPVAAMAAAMNVRRAEDEMNRIDEEYRTRTEALERQIEKLKESKEEMAVEIAKIKWQYQESINSCNRTGTSCEEEERRLIKTRFEALMDPIRQTLESMKIAKKFISDEIALRKVVKDNYDQKIEKLNSEFNERRLSHEQQAIAMEMLFRSFREDMEKTNEILAMQRREFFQETYENESVGENHRVEVTNEETNGNEVEFKQSAMRWIEPTAPQRQTVIVEDLESTDETLNSANSNGVSESGTFSQTASSGYNPEHENNSNESGISESNPEEPDEPPITFKDMPSVKRITAEGRVVPRSPEPSEPLRTSHEAERRLKELQMQVVGGGGSNEQRTKLANRRAVVEKLEKQRRTQEESATTDTDRHAGEQPDKQTFESAQDEIAAKDQTIKDLFSRTSGLLREIQDIEGEFEFDRMDYLDTIRKQEQNILWFQAVIEKILPALRRDSNYANLERILAQSEWDDLNRSWKLPKLTVDSFKLPATAGGGLGPGGASRRVQQQQAAAAANNNSDAWLDYELRSEDRFIQRLKENAVHDPAASYFNKNRAARDVRPAGSGPIQPNAASSERRFPSGHHSFVTKPLSSRELRTMSPMPNSPRKVYPPF